jgi:hypothetical protein
MNLTQMEINYALFLAFCVLQAVDAWSTLAVLEQGGREINPIMAKLFDLYGAFETLFVTKIVVAFFIWAVAIDSFVSLVILVVVYLLVVGNNMRELMRK